MSFLLALLILLVCFHSNINGISNKDASTNTTAPRNQCRMIFENPPLNDEETNVAFQLSMLSGLSYADWSGKSSLGMKKTVEFEMHNEETSRTGALLGYIRRASCQISESVRAGFTRSKLNYWHTLKAKLSSTLLQQSVNISNETCQSALSEAPHRDQHMPVTCSDTEKKSSCPTAFFTRETFQHLWFFNGWSENGIWHDTEVLISVKPGALAIVFRGSESVADVVTSSQLLEPARSSLYFRNITHGSVHRGIFNAYHKVNRGEMVPLGRDATSASVDEDGRVDRSIRAAYRDCLLSNNESRQPLDNKTFQLVTNEPCVASDVLLSTLLVQTASYALHAGRQVYLSGHSLGGALASFLALDLLINSPESEAFFTAPPSPEAALFPNAAVDSDDFDITKATANRKEKIKKQKQRNSDVNKNLSFFNNIHLYTFGEPEIADNHFFHAIFSSYAHIDHFVVHRYKRFVGLSASPNCKADVVTTLAARIAQVIGQSALGVGGSAPRRKGGFWRTPKKEMKPLTPVKAAELELGEGQDQERGDDGESPEKGENVKVMEIESQGMASIVARRQERHDRQSDNTPPGLLTQLYNRLTESSLAQNSVSTPFVAEDIATTTATPSVQTDTKDASTFVVPGGDAEHKLDEVRISYFAEPHYVCSGGAPSMLNAHRIHHYVRGIMHRKYSGILQQQSGSTDTDTDSGTGGAGGSSPAPPSFPLRHDVSLAEAQAVDMADECFHAVGNGFYTYKC